MVKWDVDYSKWGNLDVDSSDDDDNGRFADPDELQGSSWEPPAPKPAARPDCESSHAPSVERASGVRAFTPAEAAAAGLGGCPPGPHDYHDLAGLKPDEVPPIVKLEAESLDAHLAAVGNDHSAYSATAAVGPTSAPASSSEREPKS